MIPILVTSSIVQLQKGNDDKNRYYTNLAKDFVSIIKVPRKDRITKETVAIYSTDLSKAFKAGKTYILKGSHGYIPTRVSNLWYDRKDIGKFTVVYTVIDNIQPIYTLEIYNRESMKRVLSIRRNDPGDFIHFIKSKNIVQYVKHDSKGNAEFDFYRITSNKIYHKKIKGNVNSKKYYMSNTVGGEANVFVAPYNKDRIFFISPPETIKGKAPAEKLLTVVEKGNCVVQRKLYYKVTRESDGYSKITLSFDLLPVYNGSTGKMEYALAEKNNRVYATKGFPAYLLRSAHLYASHRFIGALYEPVTRAKDSSSAKKIRTIAFVLYKDLKPVASFTRKAPVEDFGVSSGTHAYMYVKDKGKYVYAFMVYSSTVEIVKYNKNNFKKPLFHKKVVLKRKNMDNIFKDHWSSVMDSFVEDSDKQLYVKPYGSFFELFKQIVDPSLTGKNKSWYRYRRVYAINTDRFPVKVYDDNTYAINNVLLHINKNGTFFISHRYYKRISNNRFLVEIPCCGEGINDSKELEPYTISLMLGHKSKRIKVVLLDTANDSVQYLSFKPIGKQNEIFSTIIPSRNSSIYILSVYGEEDEASTVLRKSYKAPLRLVISKVNNNNIAEPITVLPDDSEIMRFLQWHTTDKGLFILENNGTIVIYGDNTNFTSTVDSKKNRKAVSFVISNGKLYNLDKSVVFKGEKLLKIYTTEKKKEHENDLLYEKER
jgi:hypothetical protein